MLKKYDFFIRTPKRILTKKKMVILDLESP